MTRGIPNDSAASKAIRQLPTTSCGIGFKMMYNGTEGHAITPTGGQIGNLNIGIIFGNFFAPFNSVAVTVDSLSVESGDLIFSNEYSKELKESCCFCCWFPNSLVCCSYSSGNFKPLRTFCSNLITSSDFFSFTLVMGVEVTIFIGFIKSFFVALSANCSSLGTFCVDDDDGSVVAAVVVVVVVVVAAAALGVFNKSSLKSSLSSLLCSSFMGEYGYLSDSSSKFILLTSANGVGSSDKEALPSRKNTQLMVNSNSAAVTLRDTGFRLNVKLCCVDSILAYLRIFILALAKTRFLPMGVIWKKGGNNFAFCKGENKKSVKESFLLESLQRK
ncbi:hypothetical protein FF38_08763 [Lucilia cuprina]|uniref:Uncharacterized protein n=1 Tax=Lucilia cuprina TaxID=7375 RepID=A0A0L0CQB0_LUCCU|nr:hypothetical protein FF38_08763 [Lucilia cuprina]